ncbi:MAG: gamma-glutamylcyclotransferase, partial [Euryarchaeota archaeon]|nr:gamma-glutamylcyclotransferase [Euryarchaeota archaeon]
MAHLFAYGHLLNRDKVRELLGRVPRSRPAALRGYRRGAHPGGPWLVAEPDPVAHIEGQLLEGLSEGELDRLDRYEGVPEAVRTEGGPKEDRRRFEAKG